MSVNLCWNFGRDSFKSDDIWEAVILLCSVYTFFSVTGLSVFSISSNPVVLVMRAFPFLLCTVREASVPCFVSLLSVPLLFVHRKFFAFIYFICFILFVDLVHSNFAHCSSAARAARGVFGSLVCNHIT